MSTVSELLRATPPTDKPDALYEFVDGEWKETPRLGVFAGFVASMLSTELNAFAIPKRRARPIVRGDPRGHLAARRPVRFTGTAHNRHSAC